VATGASLAAESFADPTEGAAEAGDQVCRWCCWRPAKRADPAYQSLRDNALQGSRHDVGLEAKIEQAGDGGNGRIGVQRRVHQMPGQRGVKGHLGGLEIANLAEQNDVRILSEQGTQNGRKSQPDFLPTSTWPAMSR
jgi:hypothetical protein